MLTPFEAEGAASPNGSQSASQANHPALGRFQCLECQQTFGRVEHLTRHARSHMKERFLKCSYCRKGFYRMSVPLPECFHVITNGF
jgi:uncharacterized Zn-finger protein